MGVLLFLLALAMIATGGAAMVFGAPIIQVERGWAMVIAGSVAATGGALLLGVAVATQRLGRVAREVIALRLALPEIAALNVPEVAAPMPDPDHALPPRVAPGFRDEPPASLVLRAPEGAGIVGQYRSGGNAYVMYSDGSIHADTPSGQHRFQSLDELKSFVASGGERG